MLKLAEPYVLSISPYVPGQPLSEDNKDLSWAILGSNENCLGVSPLAEKVAAQSLAFAHLYPNATRYKVVDALCKHLEDYGVKASNIALGNGTSEIIVNLVRGLVGPQEAVLFPLPSFVMYRLATRAHGRLEVPVMVDEAMHYDLEAMLAHVRDKNSLPVKLIFLANPNNPTGDYVTDHDLKHFVDQLPPDVVLVIDEAYFDYVVAKDYQSSIPLALARPRTLVLRTFSKIYGMAGLRMGYAVGDEQIIDVLCRINDPFNVNLVAQHAAIAALKDIDHVQMSVEHNLFYKPILMEGLEKFGFRVYESVGNFVMAKRAAFMPSVAELCRQLYRKGIIIRALDDFGIAEHVRISVGTNAELQQLFKGLEETL